MPRALLLTVAIMLTMSHAAHAQTAGRQSLLIRSYNTFAVADDWMRTASRVATDTFDRAGIDVHWTECQTARARTAGAACSDVLLPREVVVRIVAAPRAARDANVLGFSYIDVASRRGTLATVYMDRVIGLARRLRADAAHMLGRAVAHEVAHLLLGTTKHASSGLMRDQWLTGRTQAADWMFSVGEADEMRAALQTLPAPGVRLAALSSASQSEPDSSHAR